MGFGGWYPCLMVQVGFAILPQALRPMEVDGLLRELPHLLEGGAVRMEEQSASDAIAMHLLTRSVRAFLERLRKG